MRLVERKAAAEDVMGLSARACSLFVEWTTIASGTYVSAKDPTPKEESGNIPLFRNAKRFLAETLEVGSLKKAGITFRPAG